MTRTEKIVATMIHWIFLCWRAGLWLLNVLAMTQAKRAEKTLIEAS